MLVTCSMARDLEMFALLAESVDAHVAPEIRHQLIVPGADLPAFRRFATSRRTVIAQEDVLPVRLWKLPGFLRLLAPIKPGFRRPIYMTGRFAAVRGWMLQQLLKIEVSRRCQDAAIMHVDSDVCFFRGFAPEDAFDGDKVRYFQALGQTSNPMHRPWIEASCGTLGLDAPADHPGHYVENCVLWSTDTVRAMVARIEEVHGKPFHEVLIGAPTMSEYYLYGIYADLIAGTAGLAPEDVSFCNSYWPPSEADGVDFDALRARLMPKHCAVAIQSTYGIDLQARAAIYDRARREMSAP